MFDPKTEFASGQAQEKVGEWAAPGVPRSSDQDAEPISAAGTSGPRDPAGSTVPTAGARGAAVLEGDLAAAFATLDSSLDAIAAGVGAIAESQVHAALVEVHRIANRVEATRLVILRESIAREPVTRTGKRSTRATKSVALDRCRRGGRTIGADLRHTELVDPDTGTFRRLGAAFTAGEVSREHLAVAGRLLSRVPSRILETSRDAIDQIVTDAARQLSPDALAQVLEALSIRLDPDGGRDPDASQRRYLSLTTDAYGMLRIRGQLDEAAGLLVQSVLDHLVAADRSGHESVDEEGRPVEGLTEVRSRGQRYADALTDAAQLAAEHLALIIDPDTNLPARDGVGGDLNQRPARSVPHVAVNLHDVADHDTDSEEDGSRAACDGVSVSDGRPCADDPPPLPPDGPPPSADQQPEWQPPGRRKRRRTWLATTADGRPIPAALLEQLVCDSVLDEIRTSRAGRVLAIHTHGRIATPAQAAAVASRDGGCVFPGCWAPPRMCHVHHVTWWTRGGRTEIDNLALLCWRHHQLVHTPVRHDDDAWHVRMIRGLAHVIRPRWLDPERRLIRNTLRDRLTQASQLGTQLLLEHP